MDATAMSLRQPLRFPPTAAATAASSSSKELRDSSALVRLRRRRPRHGVLSSGFCDRGHLQYYKSSFDSAAVTAPEEAESGRRMSVMSGKEVKSGKEEKSVKKMKKKQLKLLKGLSRDLSTFSQMGFGLDSDGALLDQIKGNMITEATQVLLEQLQKVKAEEKEAKRRMKEEKARLKAASRMQIGGNCEMSSSSSSSESSDSECGEVIDMKSLKASPYPTPIIPTIPPSDTDPTPLLASPEDKTALQPSCSSNTQNAGVGSKSNTLNTGDLGSKKIEVCMGGKCKKSGAGALLEELQRVVGIEGAVSGCKCMGKCRDGPNVKVVNGPTTAMASLCIKEDVNMIVANFIDQQQQQNHNHTGFAVAS